MKSLLPPELQPAWNVRDTVPRRERLAELAFAGYRIPRCGPFGAMSRLGVPLVVYTDELAHCGEGKVLWRPGEAVNFGTGLFCSEYVPHLGRPGYSMRWLVVGGFRFFVEYESDSSWMSNANGTYTVGSAPLPFDRSDDALSYPIYSIDFTKPWAGSDDECLANFDLNTCPGVPVEVVNLVGRDVLQASVRDFCRERGLIR